MKNQLLQGKKIGFIANTAWSMYNFRLGVMKMLASYGAEIYVVAPYDDYADKFAAFSIQFKPLTCLNAKGTNPLGDYLLYRELRQILKIIRPDFLFTYTIKPNIYGLLATKSLQIPTIAVITGLGHGLAKKGILSAVIKMFYRFALKHSVKTWFLNNDDLTFFIKNNILTEQKTLLLSGEGVDIEYFRRFVPYPDDKTVKFLYTGRFLYEKGVEDFVKAIEQLKQRGLQVEGELLGFANVLNPSAIKIETIRLWESKQIIRYLGATDDVRPYLENTNCLVFPSYYNEGMPRCLLEAASMEVPAITTNTIGCREVVKDGETGYLTEPKDVSSLVAKMEAFVRLPLVYKKEMGKNARKKVEKDFSEVKILAVYLEQLIKVMHVTSS
ncbi:glycosyltransferase family 4 protein [Parapedobacter koreensis]|uniref:Glycosyltransferase involved in cell wall bisynthesis n=1 Tax=Parapedobacter koreensis TaxID=332977 RepID=A0A1H7RGA0_9SPHI|nr:glycosyltransferase family 4 protein [Parapedobacter koreensis]SEL59213.1 Glycosyltransferase involved in cell wall bisynthesis [Parapedobacter koreensis]